MQKILQNTELVRSHGVGILTSAAAGLVEFIETKGGDPDRIFGISGVDSEYLSNPTMSMDLRQYCRIFEEAARQTQDSNFGLKFGHQFKPESLGLIGYVGICSNTLGEALNNLISTFSIHQQATLLRLRIEQNTCHLDYQVQCELIPRKRQDAELSLGVFLNIMRQALGKDWSPDEVSFEHVRPEAWHEHSRLFNAPVYFDQPYNSITFSRHLLDRQMPTRDSCLLKILLESMRMIGEKNKFVSNNYFSIDMIKARIERCLLNGDPTLQQISDDLNISYWTLQRRLNEQGLSFSELTDQVRMQLASYFLKQTNIPVTEVALRLGYSETSAFSRAFRRWFATSPKQWRTSAIG